MSIPALKWAHLQDTRKPAWQAMLYVLAHSADEECVAFRWWKSEDHWWPYLMQHTGLTRSSIFRVLNDLEHIGLISRQREDKLFVVTLRRDRVIIARKIGPGEFKLESYHRTEEQLTRLDQDVVEIPESDQAVESDHETPENVSPMVGLDESDSGTRSYMNQILESDSPFQKVSPQPGEAATAMDSQQPISPAVPPQRSPPAETRSEAPDSDTDLRRFMAAWPWSIDNPDKLKAELAKLSADQRELCMERIPLYQSQIEAERKRHPHKVAKQAHIFIRNRLFEGLKVEQSTAAKFFLAASREGAAVRAVAHLAGHAEVPSHWCSRNDAGEFGYWIWPQTMPGLAAMAPKLLALADAPSARHAWPTFRAGSGHHGAWDAFLLEAISKHCPVVSGGVIRAPWPWPPRVDGSMGLSPSGEQSTGPPLTPVETLEEARAAFAAEFDR